ncbi:MAG: response regulator [Deltaproteobacteria bacterium]|nr:response regulator [Deltaproteobacteria bacterium]
MLATQVTGLSLLIGIGVFLGWALTSRNWPVANLLVVMAAAVAACIVAARRGWVRVAGYAYSLVAIAGVVTGAILGGTVGQAGFFLCVGVILASVTLPARDVAVVFAIGFGGQAILFFLPRSVEPTASLGGAWAEGVLLYVLTGSVSVLASLSVSRLIDDLWRRDDEARAADARADALARAAEHHQRLEALGRLAGGVAHDFNNLLTVMQGCVALIEPELPPGSQTKGDVRALADAVERGAAMTRQLLAFSKRDVVQPVVLDLHLVLEDLRELLLRMVGPNANITLESSGSAWPVLASRGQIDQIVMNLVVNARDAMAGKGDIRVRLARATDGALGEVCRLAVTDTGVGLSDEVKARLFEPFFTTKGTGKGTGLGLATVYGTVSRLGGRVDVDGAPGVGATFTVVLPVAKAPPAIAVAPPHIKPGSPLPSVSVVDDDPVVRTLITRVVANAGHQVRGYGSAEELLDDEAALGDVLVTDINLPGKSGLELVDTLRPRHAALRIVIISGFTADPAEAARRLAQGAVFLSKPFEPASLIAAVTATPTPVARAS